MQWSIEDHIERFCPSCGDFFFLKDFNEETGFCRQCSPIQQTEQRIIAWLATNADHIEFHMHNGNSLSKSVELVCDDVRPTCVSCGEVIKGAARNAIFCRKRIECRRAARRYVHLYTYRKLSKFEALAIVLEEIAPTD